MKAVKSILVVLPIISVYWLLAIGSATTPPPVHVTTDTTLVPIMSGILPDKNLRIVANDRSFELVGGRRFETPFQINDWDGAPYAFTSTDKMVSNHANALSAGGRRVLIYQDGYSEPLYGVLVFNSAIKAAYGPASRSYMLKIPADKLDAARSGVTAVAFEKMSWKKTFSNGVSQEKDWYSWGLWMSSFPF